MSLLFNQPVILEKDILALYQLYKKDNEIEFDAFKEKLNKNHPDEKITEEVFNKDMRLAIKFDFHLIYLLEDLLRREKNEDNMIILAHKLSYLYQLSAKHLLTLSNDREKAKLFYQQALNYNPNDIKLRFEYGLILASSDNYLDSLLAYDYLIKASKQINKALWLSFDSDNLDKFVKFINKLEAYKNDNSELIDELLKEAFKFSKYNKFQDDVSKEVRKKYLNHLYYGYKNIKPKFKLFEKLTASLKKTKGDLSDISDEEISKYLND